MAIGVYFHPEMMTTEQYESTLRGLEEAGLGSPPGRSYHCAFTVGGSLHVWDVWDSQEAFDEFGKTLMPLIEKAGVQMGEGGPEISPIYKVISG